MSNGRDLVPHTPRAIERRVNREINVMRAHAEVSKAVVDEGTELHAYAESKVVELALFNASMLEASKHLNGLADEVGHDLRRLRADHADVVLETVRAAMANMLERSARLTVKATPDFIERSGDLLAELQDEWDRNWRK